jgi:hypothetical protein
MLAVLVSACGIGSLSDMHRDTERAADLIEKDLGSRPQTGFAGWNGTVLGSVTVIFNSGDVAQMPVAELEAHVRHALAATLKTPPQNVIISVWSGPLQLR